MKNIGLSLLICMFLFSCKEETREKVKAASKAVSAEAKVAFDSAKSKTAKVIDTAKVKQKMKTALKKGAGHVENAARKIKEKAGK